MPFASPWDLGQADLCRLVKHKGQVAGARELTSDSDSSSAIGFLPGLLLDASTSSLSMCLCQYGCSNIAPIHSHLDCRLLRLGDLMRELCILPLAV